MENRLTRRNTQNKQFNSWHEDTLKLFAHRRWTALFIYYVKSRYQPFFKQAWNILHILPRRILMFTFKKHANMGKQDSGGKHIYFHLYSIFQEIFSLLYITVHCTVYNMFFCICLFSLHSKHTCNNGTRLTLIKLGAGQHLWGVFTRPITRDRQMWQLWR